MESESRMPKEEAARALQAAEAARARAAGVPRGHAVLMLVYAVMMSAYMALFVFAGSDAVDTSTIGGHLMVLVLPPMIISTGLTNGSSDHYAGRLQRTPRYWLTVSVFFAMLAVLLGWRIFSGGYPTWVVPVAALATLVIFGIRPVMVLAAAPTSAARVPVAALPTPVRATTIIMGVLLGAVCAAVFSPVVANLLTIVTMLLVITAMSRGRTWSLPAAGWYWGRAQWVAFGVVVVVLFLLAGAILAADVRSVPLAIGAGVIVAASLIVAAFLPGRDDPDDDFAYDDLDEEPADGAPEA